MTTTGIHHVTAIASNAQSTFNFYSRLLGLRLVKKTVNQDDVSTYHLFFGDKSGQPGMDLTFFIFLPSSQGKRGNGLVTKISFAVIDTSLDFWLDRFEKRGVKNEGISERFGKKRIVFFDEDDQQLELVGLTEAEIDPTANSWTTPEISELNSVKSFYSATLSVQNKGFIKPILEDGLGYRQVDSAGNIFLYKVGDSKRAHMIEIIVDRGLPYGINHAGTVHHIAYRALDEKQQSELVAKIQALGVQTTEVIDRFYFKSVYFRTPAGILFEIATDTPGFTADEKEEDLGKKLALPPFLESQRAQIEENLHPI